MFQYLTLYNNSFKHIYIFLKSILHVTVTDSSTTIMSCLNAFFTAYTYHLHYFHIADANTLPHMAQRSPQVVPQIIHHILTANSSSETHSHRTSRYFYGHLSNKPPSFLRILSLQLPYSGGRVQCTMLCSFEQDIRGGIYEGWSNINRALSVATNEWAQLGNAAVWWGVGTLLASPSDLPFSYVCWIEDERERERERGVIYYCVTWCNKVTKQRKRWVEWNLA